MIHYDEKWYWGMAIRGTARTFEAVEKQAYRKSHTNKTMDVAFARYLIKDCIDNRGDGFKLGFFRAQSNKVAKRMVRQRIWQDDGSLKANCEIMGNKGELFLTYCAVTGSKEGSPEDPKFALKQLFESTMFPDVEKLVGPAGIYEGYKVQRPPPFRVIPISPRALRQALQNSSDAPKVEHPRTM